VIDLSTAVIWLLLMFAIALPVLPADIAQAQTQQTIVGTWAIRSRCSAPLSTIVIEPLALSGEDFYCEFDKVTRAGDTVRWTGKCNFSENGYEPSVVTAQLRGARLYYRFRSMGWNGPFNRCT
jgi:hypothetical protein